MSKVHAVLCCVCCFFLGLAVSLGAFIKVLGDDGASVVKAYTAIRSSFIGEYDSEEYLDNVLTFMVDSLEDQWSYYLSGDTYEQLQVKHSNTYRGIGINVSYINGSGLVITGVTPGSPAAAAGLTEKSIILSIDDLEVTDTNASILVGSISKSDSVPIVVLQTDGTERVVTIPCADIKQDPITSTLMEDNTGVVAIKNFYEGAGSSAVSHIEKLVNEGAERLVIDVRDNPGGYIEEMVTALDYILPEGVICTCSMKDGESITYSSDANCVPLPIAVVVNEDSFSAAEFFAAEAQECIGAKIVGAPTAGKGYAQTLVPLMNGGAVGLSTMRYYTGNGTSLIGTGVSLDVECLEEAEQITQAIKALKQEDVND